MAASRKKHVSLEFVGNDEVIQHIVTVDDVSAKKPKRSKVQTLADTPSQERPVRASRKSINYKETPRSTQRDLDSTAEHEESDEDHGDDEDEDSLNRTPTVLLEEVGMKGTEVYQFKRNKKSGQMAQLARSSATPVAAKQPAKPAETRVTRRSRRTIPDLDDDSDSSKSSSSDEDANQDDGDDNSSTDRASASRTPGRGGRRGAARGGRGGQASGGSAAKGPTTRRRAREDVNLPDMAEEYFSAHSGQAVTSDHTLAKLALPQMDQEQVSQALSDAPNSHRKEIEELYQEYRGLFNKWMFQLSNGFNLMLYGLGSKRRLLDMFRAEMLSDCSHLVINGFFPGLNVKNILNSISDDILEHDRAFSSLAEQTQFIMETLEEKEESLFLIIHNIDGVMLRSHKAQSVLSSLSQIPSVYIIATIDHINAPLIWDQSTASSFYWLWYDVTNYEPYTEETSYENSLLVQQSGVLALSSLTHVLRSLTPNARGIFNLLVEYQLSHTEDATYQGLSFSDLYQKCREAFLVNSELTLRAQLTEFRDHKLIRSKKGLDGVEFLLIAVDNPTLVEFQQQEEA